MNIKKLSTILSTALISTSITGGIILAYSIQNNDFGSQSVIKTYLSDLSCTLDHQFSPTDKPTFETLLTSFVSKKSLTNFNDLRVEGINYDLHKFKVIAVNNSTLFDIGTQATCN
jgi:hypothetical protein